MKIVLNGYGRMGKVIERICNERGHTISLIIDRHNQEEITAEQLNALAADVAIDFSLPDSAPVFIKKAFDAQLPVVSGTTAWLDQWDDVINHLEEKKGTFLYASNFSLGVNLFFELNKYLSKIMNAYPEYEPHIHEVHHTGKIDAPSGTAISLANQVLNHLDRKSEWSKVKSADNQLHVTSDRVDPAPGTHHVKYTSTIDEIEIIHTAKSRDGFALGAVIAAEYLAGKKGLHTMQDVLNIK